MSTQSVTQAFPIFNDVDGQPLESGFIYVGAAGLQPDTNQVQVYWDAAGTIPAVQPIRTIGGYPQRSGSPGKIFTATGDYSILVNNKNNSAVYQNLNAGRDDVDGITVASASALPLSYSDGQTIILDRFFTDQAGGGGIFVWDDSADKATHNGGTIIDPVVAQAELTGTSVNSAYYTAGVGTGVWERVFDGGVDVKWFGARGDYVFSTETGTDDAPAIQAALDSSVDVYFPDGEYRVNTSLVPQNGTRLSSNGQGQIASGDTTIYGSRLQTGTLRSYVDGALFDLTSASQCLFENMCFQNAVVNNASTTFNITPLYTNSKAFEIGKPARWFNCYAQGFGYGAWAFGRTLATRGSNCQIMNCYASNNFGPAISGVVAQIKIDNFECDHFQQASYMGTDKTDFDLPWATGTPYTGAIVTWDSNNVRISDSLLECSTTYSSVGILVNNNGEATPTDILIQGNKFLGSNYGVQIGGNGNVNNAIISENHFTNAPTAAQFSARWYIIDNGTQTVISANNFDGTDDDNANTGRGILARGTYALIEGNMFKDMSLLALQNYWSSWMDNVSQNSNGTYSVEFESGSSIITGNFPDFRANFKDNQFDLPINFNGGYFFNVGMENSRSPYTLIDRSAAVKDIEFRDFRQIGNAFGDVLSIATSSDASDKIIEIIVEMVVERASSQRIGKAQFLVKTTSGGGDPTLISSQLLSGNYNIGAVSDFAQLTFPSSEVRAKLQMKHSIASPEPDLDSYIVVKVRGLSGAFSLLEL